MISAAYSVDRIVVIELPVMNTTTRSSNEYRSDSTIKLHLFGD